MVYLWKNQGEIIMNKKFDLLPPDVQDEVKTALKAYNKAYVIYEYGKYNVSVGVAIKNHYADDHEFIGTYYADDVFSTEERIINYIESFHSYPGEYKGKRDYNLINSLSWNDHVMFDAAGNIVKV
jgi:hypothetical protein